MSKPDGIPSGLAKTPAIIKMLPMTKRKLNFEDGFTRGTLPNFFNHQALEFSYSEAKFLGKAGSSYLEISDWLKMRKLWAVRTATAQSLSSTCRARAVLPRGRGSRP